MLTALVHTMIFTWNESKTLLLYG